MKYLYLISGIALLFLVFSMSSRPVLPKVVSLRGTFYTLEIADTEQKRSLGLGERESLCEHCAMLFVFPYSGRYGFWMKGMKFPLDIVWLQGDTVVAMEQHVSPQSEEVYTPKEDANRVLEFNAGVLDDWKVGQKVEFLEKDPEQ